MRRIASCARRALYAALLLPTLSTAAVFEVTSNADDGAGSLRAAVVALNAHPNPDDQHDIVFRLPAAQGYIALQSPLPVIDRRFVRLIGQPVIAPGERPILGGASLRLLHLGPALEQAEIRNLDLINGSHPDGGACIDAAMLSSAAQLVLQDVTLRGCVAASEADGAQVAGAALRARGNVLVADSRIIGSQVIVGGVDARGSGGGIALLSGSLTVQDSFLDDNDVSTSSDGSTQVCDGGAISIASGSLEVIRSEISGGFVECGASSTGGGISTLGTSLRLRDSRLRQLGASVGGAVYVGNRTLGALSSVRIENSQFLDNQAWDYLGSSGVAVGGGLFITSATAGQPVIRMRNTTFAFNRSQFGEGSHLGVSSGRYEFTHSNLFGPVGDSAAGAPGSACAHGTQTQFAPEASFSIAPDASCDGFVALQVLPAASLGLVAVEPPNTSILDTALLPGSPAIDAGQPQSPSDADASACTGAAIDGRARPVDGDADGDARCDVGAQEFEDPTLFRDGFEP